MNTRGSLKRNDLQNVNGVDLDQLSEESRALYMLISEKFDHSLHVLEARLEERDKKDTRA